MNDLQIDKALALAIGWKQHQIGLGFHGSEQCIGINESLAGDSGEPRTFYDKSAGGWCVVFDHKDWNVISPIAQVYDCFPKKNIWGDWFAIVYCGSGQKRLVGSFHADTPQKAIALAVIGASK